MARPAAVAVFLGLQLALLPAVPSPAAARAAGDLPNGGDIRALSTATLLSPAAVQAFYGARDYRRVWTATDTEALAALQAAIGDATSHGLSPADYHAAALADAVAAQRWDEVEILATDAYLTLGAHLLRGKVDPVSVEPNWTASRRTADLVAHLEQAVEQGRVRDSLAALAPSVPSYRALQRELARSLAAAQGSELPKVPEGPSLKPGMQGPRVAALRARLAAEDLVEANPAGEADAFDAPLEAAVGAFQRRIGLEADGVAGPLTLRELNRSPRERAAQLRANLERWRWLDEDLGARHIRVNIAEFRLETWENGKPTGAHDVIVGRAYRKTPVFSDRIGFVVLNPWWETPPNIARLDKLPAFRSDPGSVERLGFEIFDQAGQKREPASIDWGEYSARNFPFRLRQRPGPQNALGMVKLMFPNPHNVYLHDTPGRDLFRRSRRDFSSGCVRVDDVLGLTEWVLAETPNWDRDALDSAVASGREQRINLAAKVPVHIMYLTAVRLGDDTVRLLPDIYERDRPLIAALDRKSAK